ncbi:MAG: dihydrodipicolinate synthase family protein [Bacteroidota bacterium]
MNTSDFYGLIAAPISPMKSNGDIDLGRIQDLVKLYLKNGVKGAFICGTTGEGSSLRVDEVKAYAEEWKRVGGDLRLILCVGGDNVQEMQELAAYGGELKLDGISMLSPYYFKPKSEEDLLGLCQEVSAAAPGVPFYYYHIPTLSGGYFSIRKFLGLAKEELPDLRGIKYTFHDLYDFYRCRAFENGKYEMFWGTDEVLLSALVAGANGAVGSTYNYAAPLYNQIIKAFQEGDWEKALKLQDKAVEMVELLIAYGGTGATKAFMKIIGLDCGEYRAPIVNPSAAEIKELENKLKRIGFFDFCSKPA